VFFKIALLKSAFHITPFFKIALVRFELLKFAKIKFVSLKFAPLKSALLKFAPLKFLFVKIFSFKFLHPDKSKLKFGIAALQLGDLF